MKKLFVFCFSLFIYSSVYAQSSILSRIASQPAKVGAAGLSTQSLARLSKEISRQNPALEALSRMNHVEKALLLSGANPVRLRRGDVAPELVTIEKVLRRRTVEKQAVLLNEFKANPAAFQAEVAYMGIERLEELSFDVPHQIIFVQGEGDFRRYNQAGQLLLSEIQKADGNLFTGNVVFGLSDAFEYPYVPSQYHKILSPFYDLSSDVLKARWKHKNIFSSDAIDVLNDMNYQTRPVDLSGYYKAARRVAGADKAQPPFLYLGEQDISIRVAGQIHALRARMQASGSTGRIIVLNDVSNQLPMLINRANCISAYLPEESLTVLFTAEEPKIDAYFRQTAGITLPAGKIVVRKARGKAAQLLGANLLIWVR